MFHRLSKHLKFRHKYSAARRIFKSLLGVWKCDETLPLVFDMLLNCRSCLTACAFTQTRAFSELDLTISLTRDRFRSITKQYFRKADGVIVFYDVTMETSFLNIKNWMISVEVNKLLQIK